MHAGKNTKIKTLFAPPRIKEYIKSGIAMIETNRMTYLKAL
jgi:hypothetical protein